MVLKLSFACWDYDRMKAIEDGKVRADGIEITFLNYRVEETSVNLPTLVTSVEKEAWELTVPEQLLSPAPLPGV